MCSRDSAVLVSLIRFCRRFVSFDVVRKLHTLNLTYDSKKEIFQQLRFLTKKKILQNGCLFDFKFLPESDGEIIPAVFIRDSVSPREKRRDIRYLLLHGVIFPCERYYGNMRHG